MANHRRREDDPAPAFRSALALGAFRYLRHETYSCGAQSNEMPLFEHVQTGLSFSLIPGGTFQMGGPEVEGGSEPIEQAKHEVRVPPFLLAQTPCTQEAWCRVDPENPAFNKESPQHPVERVDWNDAQRWLQRTEGLRLPSEAEWEYACRAGTTTAFYFGANVTTDQVNYNGRPFRDAAPGTNRKQTTRVGTFAPNAFGLFDMHGNVSEWCQDTWQFPYDERAPTDGSPWEMAPAAQRLSVQRHGNTYNHREGATRVHRGGSYWNGAGESASAARHGYTPDHGFGYNGFRPAASLVGGPSKKHGGARGPAVLRP